MDKEILFQKHPNAIEVSPKVVGIMNLNRFYWSKDDSLPSLEPGQVYFVGVVFNAQHHAVPLYTIVDGDPLSEAVYFRDLSDLTTDSNGLCNNFLPPEIFKQ